MKVTVKTNFNLVAGGNGNSVELDLASPTLKSVLECISVEYQKDMPIFNVDTNEIDSEEYSVLLNGASYQFLPEKLLTPLREGDLVQLFHWFELLGGG